MTTVYSLVVTDANGCSSSNDATATVTVTPAAGPATHFVLSAPSNTTTGLPFTVTVTARDALDQVATGYAGTVQFGSSDGSAVLPSSYTFGPADAGVHSFPYAFRLNAAGSQSITATDTSNATITGSATLSVRQAVVTTWTGAVSDLWSETGNWSAGAPQQGDTLVFPSGAQHLTNTNDLAVGTVFGSSVFNGGGYTVSGNAIGLSGGISGNSGSNVFNSAIQLVSSQNFGGGVTVNGSLDLQGYTLSVGGSLRVNGVVSGGGGINVSGGGSLSLGNAGNSYSGTTSIAGGQLYLFSGNASNVAATNGFIMGNGSTGTLSMTGGTLYPLDPNTGAPGLLSTGSPSLSLSSTQFRPSILGPMPGTDYSQVRVSGTVALGNSSLNITFSPSFVPSVGQVFILIDNDGSDPVSGTFNGRPEGSTITLNGAYQFQISYAGGDGNDVTLASTVVPKSWTGAASDLWSNAGNWIGGVPGTGDVILFPSGAQHLTNTNDLAVGTVFGSLVFNGGGYTVSGNAIGLSGGISGNSGSNVFNSAIQLVSSQNFGGGVTVNGSLDLQGYTLSVGGSLRVNGVVSGGGGINVSGGGSLSLGNAGNSYSGTTSIAGGQLYLFSGNASNVAATNGFIMGNGSTGTLSMTGGTLYPLDPNTGAPGLLSTGSPSLSLSSTQFRPSILGPMPGTDYSQVRVSGTVALGNSSLNITFSPSFVPSVGQVFILIDNDGSDPVSGTFNGRPEGSTITLNGAYPFRLSYFGNDGNDVVLTSLSGAQPTTTAIVSSPNPSNPGQSVTFTATVTGSGGTPTGNVSFREGGLVLGTGMLSGGIASFTTSVLAVGSHPISALYGGDGTFGSSASAPVQQVVSSPATAMVSGGGTVCAGQSATIQTALTGTAPWSVNWSDGVTQAGVAVSPVVRSVSPATTTTYTVTSISDANGPGTASGSATLEVEPLPSATIMPAGPITLLVGETATLTASAGAAWAWSTGETTQAITVSTSGGYLVTVTNPEGCSATSAPVVVTVALPCGPTASEYIVPTANSFPGRNSSRVGRRTLVHRAGCKQDLAGWRSTERQSKSSPCPRRTADQSRSLLVRMALSGLQSRPPTRLGD